ncbi:MAG: SUF system Fe-S cluster assembly protein [Rhodospirillales bacterium]|nr:SUF system Fe-S cluster assembly protein [Rhodospirillales bacterium]
MSERVDNGNGQVASAGSPLPPGHGPADENTVVEALRTVYDPEIPVNIYDLGLIYTIDCQPDGAVAIDMTLTAPACPVAGELPASVADVVAQAEGVGEVTVRLVWEPRWTQDLMSEDARLAIGFV